ncbi:MAG: FAD-dependent oxidoreductase [Akkermansiaceae bacterium]|jgi:NADPH-dependent 2,4-dienoyl-CoA reductase/sulfur reductase-like enzyme/rhodanese-related sulfurtransferase|nr:FAD-dependent oxidoreductase [Akkermansiaceae bacterium]
MKTTPDTIVIIGGVAGGASAAARARRHSEAAHIILLERGPDVSFANCGLPYHIGGEIPDRADLAVQTPDSLRALLNLDVRTLTEAISIDRSNQQVLVRSLADSSESLISYDKLILAPGASPLRPPLPGIDSPLIHTLRNLQDMDRIKQAAASAQHVAIIGAGFIGLEMAEQLHEIGKQVSVIELQPQILPQLDAEMVRPLEDTLRDKGIELILGDGIDGFEMISNQISAKLKSGKNLATDLVILSIGVRPESGLAKAAGLELGPRGHIVVDSYQLTSDPHIYAVGDVCETEDPILGKRTAIPLGGPANRQGRTAADHIFLGEKALRYPGSIGTAIVRVFDHAAGITGYSETRLKQEGVSYQTVTVNGSSHASYYPGSETITLKLLWSPEDGRVLGAQASGKDGVDKRLDVIATALRGRLNIDDLAHLELAYAPPFGSAKDVVNVAGFAAGNMRDGLLVPVADLASAGAQIIDVRPAASAAKLPVPGAKNIPLPQLRSRLAEIDRSQPVFTVCQMGKTSYFAARILANHGFDARSILGGAHHQVRK